MNIKTGKELAAACLDVAKNHKTLYVMGCFGSPMTEANKERYTSNHEYNARPHRKKLIMEASADTFGFDCVCLIKGLLWGWDADTGHIYGGADYGSNGVPDIGTEQIIGVCSDVSTDFSEIAVGELLWMKGHVGIYIGDGLCVECTPAWMNRVQITAVHNIGRKSGYNGRIWAKHGKLPYVAYTASDPQPSKPGAGPKPAPQVPVITGLPLLKMGAKGDSVRAMQILLLGYGYDLDVYGADGEFGAVTELAVKDFQHEHDLEDDGEVGNLTWAELLGV